LPTNGGAAVVRFEGAEMMDQAEKRGQLIRHLEDALTLADENQARPRRSALASI
jgi:hypothetical protein